MRARALPSRTGLGRRFTIESLEMRLMLSLDAVVAADQLAPLIDPIGYAPAPEGLLFEPVDAVAPPPPIAYETTPEGLPILNSFPAAPMGVYLDFDGYEPRGATPYDLDGDPTTFDADEQANIYEGWYRLAMNLAPFDVNVTTEVPTVPYSWSIVSNSVSGGYSYGFVNGTWPASYNTSGDLIGRTSGILHEIGHNFGLGHQAEYDLLGNKTREYRLGIDPLHGPIMGVDFDGWIKKWYNHRRTGGADRLQDDVAKFAAKVAQYDDNPAGDGFRDDDFGDTIATATPLAVDGQAQSITGIIERMDDQDVFSFTADGRTGLYVDRVSMSGIDLKLEVYAADGTLLASRDSDIHAQYVDVTLPTGTYYATVATHGDYSDIGTYELIVEPQTLPSEWLNRDVGLMARGGKAGFDQPSDTFTIDAVGDDVDGHSDELHFVYQPLDGDGSIVAHVASVEDTHDSAKTGVMIRQSLDTAAEQVFMFTTPDAGSGLRWRDTAGGDTSSSTRFGDAFSPIWVKLERTGDTIEGSYSDDGVNWTLHHSVDVGFDQHVLVGLASSSHRSSTVGTATLDGVALTGNVGIPTPTINALPAPTALAVTTSTDSSHTLSWNAVAGATGYSVERSDDGEHYFVVATTDAATTTLADTGLPSHQRFFYRVRAADATGVSVASEVVHATTRPGPVTNIRVLSLSQSMLSLDWYDVDGDTGYRVERSTDGVSFVEVATLEANVQVANDDGLEFGTEYFYRIVTLDATGDAATSPVVSRFTRLPPVSGLVFTTIASSQLDLAWDDLSSETGYRIERSTDGEQFSELTTLPADTSSYVDSDVSPLGEYYYRVIPVNGDLPGVESTIFAATPDAAPLPSPWTLSDVGAVSAAGAAGWQNGTLTIISGGSDLDNTNDSLTLVHQPLAGDTTVVVQVASNEATGGNAATGLMFRDTLDTNSRHYSVVVESDGDVKLKYRRTTGGNPTSVSIDGEPPVWLRIDRSGDTFRAYTSPDGGVWTQLGGDVIVEMGETALVGGMGVAYADDLLHQGTVDNLQIGFPAPLAVTDTYELDEDGSLLAAPGVLTNDLNRTADGVTVELVDPPAHGTAAFDAANALTYTPVADYHGPDTFTYRLTTDPVTILGIGSRWRYLDTGADPGPTWTQAAFDDSTWAEGPAELGYGDGDEQTVVGFGGDDQNKFATTLFRRTLTLPTDVSASELSLRLVRDDAAAVYLDGVEVYRDTNLDPGATFDDYATSTIGDEDEIITIPVAGVALAPGDHTLAVEVHQASGTSSDISFNLELVGRLTSAPGVVNLTINPVDDLPTAVDDQYAAAADTPLIIPTAIGLTANDVDADGGTLEVLLEDGPQHGALTLAIDGGFTYQPDAGYVGPDAFNYRATNNIASALIQRGADWRYLDDGSNQGTAWQATGFDDATWAAGPAELGYGDGDEATTVAGGPDGARFATTYFRHTFDVADPSSVGALTLWLLRDDAAAVYVNGVEVHRDDNLPAGAASDVYATADSDENETSTHAIDPAVLVAGTNVIAVEVHQGDANSSDVSFDLELTAVGVSNLATVDIDVVAINDPPTAVDDQYDTLPETPIVVDALQGVTANDVDPQTSPLYAVLVDGPQHGTLALAADGGFDYQPEVGFAGQDQFTYRIGDGVEQTLIAAGADWRYLDDGSDQGVGWRASGFDDGVWQSGPAQLGYGDGDEATPIASGPAGSHYATTYFRHAFDLGDGAASDLSMWLLRDDAAAVYLNGVEVYRDDILPAAAAFDTYADDVGPENGAVTFPVDAALLVEGVNVVAVEVHQSDGGSSDVSFDLALTGARLSNLATAAIRVASGDPEVVGRYVFYNDSVWDGNDAEIDPQDAEAIAADKTALRPGQPATPANITSFARGVNGIMVDLANVPDANQLQLADFAFRAGNTGDPNQWPAVSLTGAALWVGGGPGGATRLAFGFADGAVAGQWLQVTVLAGERTGLAVDDVFYFGNAVGETGNDAANALVTAADVVATRDHPHGPGNRAAIDNPFDFNRDALVDAVDAVLARNAVTGPFTALRLITSPQPSPPPAEGQPPPALPPTIGQDAATEPPNGRPSVFPPIDRAIQSPAAFDAVLAHFTPRPSIQESSSPPRRLLRTEAEPVPFEHLLEGLNEVTRRVGATPS